MREVKFRAWDKYSNTVRLVKSIRYGDDGFAKTILVHLVGGINGGYVHGESCELMQYTGLKDRNGKEIYEGDVLDGSYINPMSNEVIKKHYEVVYRKATFYAELIGKHPYGTTSLYFENEKSEVIGNIYENPELIKTNN